MAEAMLRNRFGQASSATTTTTSTVTNPPSMSTTITTSAVPPLPAANVTPTVFTNGPGSPAIHDQRLSTPAARAGASINFNQFDGSVAASFYISKGTELLSFTRRKIEEHNIRTSLVKSQDEKYNVLLMSLPYAQMVQTAEELGLRKRDLEGTVRTFCAADADLFTSSPTPDALFSQSEQILLLEYRLDNIKPDANFDDVLGNESILEWCKRQHYLEDVFPLHNRPSAAAVLAELSWSRPLYDVGGISKIQDYFGDKVALYFAFLTFYTKALMTFAAAGIVVTIFSMLFKSHYPVMMFMYTIFATLWGAAFVSLWKRRNIEIVYMWTSLIMGDSADESLMSISKKEDLRRQFYGVEVSHRITGEKVTVFPKKKKLTKLFISVAVLIVTLFISTRLLLLALDFEDIMAQWIKEKAPLHKWSSSYFMTQMVLPKVPDIVYIGCLYLLDTIYSTIAKELTENENHKYNSEFENSLVLKLMLFQFLNMNMAYLYVAFVRRDYERLASSIRMILLLELVIGNIKEVAIPIFMANRRKKAMLAEAAKKKKEENPDLDDTECVVTVEELDPISTQLDMEPYDGIFEDYFELVRQFSQISLFAAAFPLGALVAALNNFVEIYADTYKLVHRSRRVSPQRALNIGAWIRAFEFLGIVSIMTNLGIMTITAGISDKVVGSGRSNTNEYFWMVVIEHVLVVSRFLFATLFEGIPSWVRDQRAKERFVAARKEAAQRDKKTPNASPP